MLMFCRFPFLLRETLSKISGISEAMGARKNANRIELTFESVNDFLDIVRAYVSDGGDLDDCYNEWL